MFVPVLSKVYCVNVILLNPVALYFEYQIQSISIVCMVWCVSIINPRRALYKNRAMHRVASGMISPFFFLGPRCELNVSAEGK